MKVHLRKRIGRISPENQKKGKKLMSSLYLSYQAKNSSKVQYEWLNLYLYENPKSNLEKEHNKATMQLAESIKAKKIIDMQTTNHGFASSVKGKISFLEYFKKLTDKKFEESAGNYGNWFSAYTHLKSFCNNKDYSLEQIDEYFLESFKEYLLKTTTRRNSEKLNPNSAQSYFNKIRAALREAYMNKMIKENPCNRVKSIKAIETTRQFLTVEELKSLVATPCRTDLLKKAFLFSALTGLRWSDVKAMTWNKIKKENDGWSIHFTQKKTKGAEVLPVSEQAIKVLGEPLDDKNKEIFKNLIYNNWMNKKLHDWIFQAGIHKKITFHCARHSFATLQLSMNTDIYTVSKLLGHRHLKTTEIYAKVIDRKKIDAAKRIPELI